VPAVSTLQAILDRHGCVTHRRKRTHHQAVGTHLRVAKEPNDLWCADYKGHFRMKNKEYCYPLTISDQVSRYVLSCEGLERPKMDPSFRVFERTFREYGLPEAIRTDNGAPFYTQGVFGLSMLTVWWIRLGIALERIRPGHPEENGRHERMHLTLKLSATKPPQANILAQQERFDEFVEEFNGERPHEALQMKVPAQVYKKSPRPYPQRLPEPEYPGHDRVVDVSLCGRISQHGKSIFISRALGGQTLGLREVEDGVWQVNFFDYNMGFFDQQSRQFAPGANPFVIPRD